MKKVPKLLLAKHFAIYDASLKRFPDKYLHFITENSDEHYEHLCYVCPLCTNNWVMIDRKGYRASSEFSEDHFPPESLGGKSKLLVCKKCNNDAGPYEKSLIDKIELVSFNKRVPNSSLRTASNISDVRGWHNGSLSIDEAGQMHYQVKNKGKQKLRELTEWENSTNNGGKGWQMEVKLKNPSEEKFSKALLKAAYLYCFSNWGYDFVFSNAGELFRNSLKNFISYPIKVGWLWLDFQTPVHEGPGIPEGLCFLHKPNKLQSLVVNLPLRQKTNNYGCIVPILIPDPTEQGNERIISVQQTFENEPGQTISLVPVNNYLHLKKFNCYNETWNDLMKQYNI